MLIKQTIINSSPLIVLFKSKQADLLPQLFEEILVPESVWDEITKTSQNDAAAQQLPTVSWIQRVQGIIIAPEVAAWDLGAGESSVLSFSLNYPNYAAIVDDRAAKKCAQSLGIITLGTGSILLLAKRRGLIDAVTPRLEALKNTGLWLSDRIFNLIKQQAGE